MDKVFKSYKLSMVTAMAEVGRIQGMRIPWPAEEMTSKPFGGGSGKEFMAFFFLQSTHLPTAMDRLVSPAYPPCNFIF